MKLKYYFPHLLGPPQRLEDSVTGCRNTRLDDLLTSESSQASSSLNENVICLEKNKCNETKQTLWDRQLLVLHAYHLWHWFQQKLHHTTETIHYVVIVVKYLFKKNLLDARLRFHVQQCCNQSTWGCLRTIRYCAAERWHIYRQGVMRCNLQWSGAVCSTYTI